MRKWAVLGLAVAAACGGGAGSASGQAVPIRSLRTVLGSALACTPGQTFCEGNTRWMCDFNGDDASDPHDCQAAAWGGPGSATNPHVCAAGDCADGSANCCRYAKPLCAFSLSSPVVVSLRDYGPDNRAADAAVWCKPPREYPQKPLEFYVSDSEQAAFWFFVAFDDASLVGQTLTLPNPHVDVAFASVEHGNFFCDEWSGTVDWSAPRPSWAAQVDLTCASDPSYRLKGTFAGDE